MLQSASRGGLVPGGRVPGGCLVGGGLLPGGSAPGGVPGPGGGGCLPQCMLGYHPLLAEFLTHACENITLAQLRCGR